MIALNIETTGTQKFARAFNSYVEDIRDFRPWFDMVKIDLGKMVKKNIDAGGEPETFKPLSEDYAKWKSRKYPGNPILVLTGALRDAFTNGTDKTVNEQTNTRAEFGTTLGYAEHQFRAGRKIVQLTDADRERWVQMLQVWAHRVARENLDDVADTAGPIERIYGV